jgi:hypothetical protein
MKVVRFVILIFAAVYHICCPQFENKLPCAILPSRFGFIPLLVPKFALYVYISYWHKSDKDECIGISAFYGPAGLSLKILVLETSDY